MAISYPLSMPNDNLASVTIRSVTNIGVARSIFTGKQQVFQHSYESLAIDVSLPPLERENAEPWIAFLLALRGPLGTFLAGDVAGKTPRGAASGTPRVNGASQIGTSLVTDGWTPGVTNILKKGDWIQVGSRIYKNLNDVNSDGSGNATLDIFPRLRQSPADNDLILTNNTKGLFRLLSNDVPVAVINKAKHYEIAFSAAEAL